MQLFGKRRYVALAFALLVVFWGSAFSVVIGTVLIVCGVYTINRSPTGEDKHTSARPAIRVGYRHIEKLWP